MKKNLIALFFIFFTGSAWADGQLISHYDRQTDQLSLKANNARLLDVLKRVSLQTGVEVMADEHVDRVVSVEIQKLSLEKSIKALTRGLNTAIFYETSEPDGQAVISQVRVLPDGVADISRAKSLVSLENAALAYAQLSVVPPADTDASNSSSKIDANNFDYMETRWLTRVAQLPLETRTRVQTLLREQQDRREQRIAAIEQRNELAHKQREELEMKQQARENQLEVQNPERYALRQQRLERIKEEIRLSKQD